MIGDSQNLQAPIYYANIYPHLEYVSKVQLAQAIAGIIEGTKKEE